MPYARTWPDGLGTSDVPKADADWLSRRSIVVDPAGGSLMPGEGSRQGSMRCREDGQLDALCSALDGLQTEAELAALTAEKGLQCVPSIEGPLRIWKGRSKGAVVEIAIAPSSCAPGRWELRVLVTSGPRVEHVRRRPWKV